MLYAAEFWVAVAFFVFVGILFYMKAPAMLTKALDDRAEAIRKELDDARRLREEAQDLLADYQRKQREAETEAQQIIEAARREAEALKAEGERSVKESLARRSRLAEEKIARAEAQALAEVRAAAVEAATAAAERIVRGKLEGGLGSGLIEQSIRDLKGKLN
ncbi:MAG: F0F1 ATP synthase subunit B [Bacteroidota bacterium]|jgi:F-type H+-transporting ATPase subunit b|nr:F0F1 ATP synthase subunit B [Hyphomicrobiaceae bacterium]